MNKRQAEDLLNLVEPYSLEDIKKQYRTMSKRYHPDKAKDNGQKFKQLQLAYELVQQSLPKEEMYTEYTHQSILNIKPLR